MVGSGAIKKGYIVSKEWHSKFSTAPHMHPYIHTCTPTQTHISVHKLHIHTHLYTHIPTHTHTHTLLYYSVALKVWLLGAPVDSLPVLVTVLHPPEEPGPITHWFKDIRVVSNLGQLETKGLYTLACSVFMWTFLIFWDKTIGLGVINHVILNVYRFLEFDAVFSRSCVPQLSEQPAALHPALHSLPLQILATVFWYMRLTVILFFSNN